MENSIFLNLSNDLSNLSQYVNFNYNFINHNHIGILFNIYELMDINIPLYNYLYNYYLLCFDYMKECSTEKKMRIDNFVASAFINDDWILQKISFYRLSSIWIL